MLLPKPTKVPEKFIIEFQQLYKKRYGIDLSREDAIEKELRLMRFLTAIINHNDRYWINR